MRRWVEQLAARRAHNPEAVGSSPTPAILKTSLSWEVFFILNEICLISHHGLEPE